MCASATSILTKYYLYKLPITIWYGNLYSIYSYLKTGGTRLTGTAVDMVQWLFIKLTASAAVLLVCYGRAG